MNPTIQILDLDAIKVDHRIQSRVETRADYQREFSEAMLRGDEFPPIATFFDGISFWLADGFHRYGARRAIARTDRQFQAIKSAVYAGSKMDAIVFSAGANQKFSIPRVPEDIKKAVFMLRELPEWKEVHPSEVAKHVGITLVTARKYSILYFESLGLPVPPAITKRPKPKVAGARIYEQKPGKVRGKKTRNSSFFTKIGGRIIGLGTDRERAEAQLEGILSGKVAHPAVRRVPLGANDNTNLSTYLVNRGIAVEGFELHGSGMGLRGFRGKGFFLTWDGGSGLNEIVESFGRVMLMRGDFEIASQRPRAVVLRYPTAFGDLIIERARQHGVEFLTPEEFVAQLDPES